LVAGTEDVAILNVVGEDELEHDYIIAGWFKRERAKSGWEVLAALPVISHGCHWVLGVEPASLSVGVVCEHCRKVGGGKEVVDEAGISDALVLLLGHYIVECWGQKCCQLQV